MVTTAFKPHAYVLEIPPQLIPDAPTLDNFTRAWSSGDFARYFANSVFVAVLSTAISVSLAAMLGFAFARYDFPGRRVFFGALLFTMMVPGMVLLIPQFVLARNLGLLNSLWGLVAVYSVMNLGLNTFLLRGFFASMPQDLFDAASVDGAGVWRSFRSVALPLARPGLATVTIFSFLAAWDEFTWAITTLSDRSCTRCPSASGCSSARRRRSGASCSRPRSSRWRRCWSSSSRSSASSWRARSWARRRVVSRLDDRMTARSNGDEGDGPNGASGPSATPGSAPQPGHHPRGGQAPTGATPRRPDLQPVRLRLAPRRVVHGRGARPRRRAGHGGPLPRLGRRRRARRSRWGRALDRRRRAAASRTCGLPALPLHHRRNPIACVTACRPVRAIGTVGEDRGMRP